MVLLKSIEELKNWRSGVKNTVGFVPTMGALHQGHLKLLEISKKNNKVSVLSIFVNPLQFNDKSDFSNYPKTIDSDLRLAKDANVDCVFLPSVQDMYPLSSSVTLSETEISSILEGKYRPGHFTGVLTVVLKLLNLTQPTNAYFGEKDYQQFLLIKKMAEDLFLNTKIVPVPTVRDSFGLALSSRNARLSESEIQLARQINKILIESKNSEIAKSHLIQNGFKVDYVEDFYGRRFVAAFIGEVRLIDNVEL